jgi:anti-sigma regulatory factor (Ser/Thr protein kinase)
VTVATGPGYLHHALLYDSADELLSAAVPFLADGLAAGEAAVLSCGEVHNRLLAEALGGDDRIVHMDRTTVYTGIGQAISAYRRMTHRLAVAGAPRIRLVGEVPVSDHPEAQVQWTAFEAAGNVAMAPLPLSSVCAYDTRALPEPLRLGIEQTHPVLLAARGRTINDGYVEPATILRRTTARGPDPIEVTAPALRLDDLDDIGRLPSLRAQLRTVLERPGTQQHVRADFAAAVAEILANAFRHGRPPVTLQLWTTPARLLCTVTDHGQGFDDPLAGFLAPGDEPRGRVGLWLVRQTCDTVTRSWAPAGFTVRLSAALPPPGRPPRVEPWTVYAEAAVVRAERARSRARALRRALTDRFDAAADLDRGGQQAVARLRSLEDDLRRRQGRGEDG